MFIGDPRVTVTPSHRMFERMARVLDESAAGMVYADGVDRPRIDYQIGSIRDNFDFGPVIAISVPRARRVELGDWRWGGFGWQLV